MPKARTPLDMERIVALQRQGLSQRQIARELGMAESTLRENLRAMQQAQASHGLLQGDQRPPPGDQGRRLPHVSPGPPQSDQIETAALADSPPLGGPAEDVGGPPQERSAAGGHIYAIGVPGTEFVKIGSTRATVTGRMQSIQAGKASRLSILAQVPVDANLRRVERLVHTFLAQERQQGEWFAAPMDQSTLEQLVARAIQLIIQMDEEFREWQRQQQDAAEGTPDVYPGGPLTLLSAQDLQDLQALLAWWRDRQRLVQDEAAPERQLERQTYHVEKRFIEAVRREADLTGESYAAVVNRAFAQYFASKSP